MLAELEECALCTMRHDMFHYLIQFYSDLNNVYFKSKY
jgi:hypothetical protein